MPSTRDTIAPPVRRIVGGRRFDLRGILRDLATGFRHHEVWLAFAWDEIQNRYRRSALGLAWLAISYLIYVFAIATFFGGFSGLDGRLFVQHVAFGMLIYNVVIGNIVDGCSVFVRASGWVKSASLPYAVYVYRGVSRAAFPFAVQAAVAAVLMPLFGWRPEPIGLMAAPALLLIIVLGVAVQYALGLVCARVRDIEHFVQAVSRVFFFTTPILWVYEETEGVRRQLADIIPITPFIEIFRDPLLGMAPDPAQWAQALAWTALAWAAAVLLGAAMRSKLPFWV